VAVKPQDQEAPKSTRQVGSFFGLNLIQLPDREGTLYLRKLKTSPVLSGLMPSDQCSFSMQKPLLRLGKKITSEALTGGGFLVQ